MLPTPEDYVAISDLIARYCLTLDRDDVEAWVALFTPDATYEVYGRTFEGHDGLRRMLHAAPGGLHLGGPPVIDMLDPGRARTTRNLLFIGRGGAPQRCAIYTDDLVRTAEGWRIGKTRCQFITAEGLSDRPED
ncbi:MAG: nuclear transport factor 2 family protein [Dehalococcoidia bacterium]